MHHHDTICTEHTFDGGVIRYYSESSGHPSRQLARTKNVRFNEKVPAEFVPAEGTPCLIILDDLLNDVHTEDVCDLFTKGRNHRKICVILITKNLFIRGGTLAISH